MPQSTPPLIEVSDLRYAPQGRVIFDGLTVSLDARRIGIIGRNGSGKTTLLRILAGQLLPDQGEVMIRGTSAAMIDLQAGFQAKASGRENIYLRAAALGFRRSETAARVQEIIDFSELEHAIDAPLASYSSGMKMRLAFSVMAMVAPEVMSTCGRGCTS